MALARSELPWLAGAIGSGGVVGPLLLMVGLTRTDAATASLLLTLELKGLIAGPFNLALGLLLGAAIPQISTALVAGVVGFVGISLALFVLALRGLGAARNSAYFSTAPFIGSAARCFWRSRVGTTADRGRINGHRGCGCT